LKEESQLEGIIIDADNYTIAFLTNNGRELLVFKHAVRFIEKVKGK
jgi:sRNA-binding regulator protein Hfq